MTALRHALQWLGLLVSLPFSAWGAVRLMTDADKRSLIADNFGLDRPGEMADAWAKVRARPWSPHAWKDVTAEFCGQGHSQVPAKVLSAVVVIVFVVGLLAGCGDRFDPPDRDGAGDHDGRRAAAGAIVRGIWP